jgi:aldose 1-epimerase
VVLGLKEISLYADDHPYLGSTVGRFANRVAGASFVLDGKRFPLDANEGVNHLHGGRGGFHVAPFKVRLAKRARWVDATFSRMSPDGEQGYPGNLSVTVRYRLSPPGILRIDFRARTDRATVVNLSHHSYFNLSGGARDAREHTLVIRAERYVPLDPAGLPTGTTARVRGTPFDFREARRIGDRIGDGSLASRGGYDHPFVLRARPTMAAHPAATLRDPSSGRVLDVFTTEPIIHLYTSQGLSAEQYPEITPRGGPFAGVCLETGRAPGCTNDPALGAARLDPSACYEHTVIYRFSSRPRAGPQSPRDAAWK